MLIQRMQWTSGCKLFSRRLVKCSAPHGSKVVRACAQAKLTLGLHSLLCDLSDVVASVSTFSSGRPNQRRVYPSDLLIAN